MTNYETTDYTISYDLPTPIPVLVTTEYRGVFFGYANANETSGDNITLTNARNCLYWSAATGGFLGLAATGPAERSRIGATTPHLELRKVTSVARVTPEAEKVWVEYPVYRGE